MMIIHFVERIETLSGMLPYSGNQITCSPVMVQSNRKATDIDAPGKAVAYLFQGRRYVEIYGGHGSVECGEEGFVPATK